MASFEIISLFAFIAIVGLLLLKDRKNLTFNYGIIVRRWTRGLELIDALVRGHRKHIIILGNIGVALGVVIGISGVGILIYLTMQAERVFGLVLPTAGNYQIPGPVFSVPFWYWLIAIFIIAVTHETFHAIFIRLEKVPVKNYGILLFLLLPIGAFVDPDNDKIKRLAFTKKLRIFAAGSLINIIVAIVAVLVFAGGVFAFGGLAKTSGVMIDSIAPNSPAESAGLQGNIHEINGEPVKSTLDFVYALNGTRAGDEINIITDKGSYNLVLESNPKNENRTYIGVSIRNSYQYNVMGLAGDVPLVLVRLFFTVMSFLNWLFLISSGVAVVNMLPVKPLDGGLFFGEIFNKMFGTRGNLIINVTSMIILAMILFNIFGVSLLQRFIG